jgi:hypothetical protein
MECNVPEGFTVDSHNQSRTNSQEQMLVHTFLVAQLVDEMPGCTMMGTKRSSLIK